jgi:hypothetical protein
MKKKKRILWVQILAPPLIMGDLRQVTCYFTVLNFPHCVPKRGVKINSAHVEGLLGLNKIVHKRILCCIWHIVGTE